MSSKPNFIQTITPETAKIITYRTKMIAKAGVVGKRISVNKLQKVKNENHDKPKHWVHKDLIKEKNALRRAKIQNEDTRIANNSITYLSRTPIKQKKKGRRVSL